MTNAVCRHPGGCTRTIKAYGWCRAHWDRIRKTGDPGPAQVATRKPGSRACRIKGCDRAVGDSGGHDMCSKHYQRHYRHGADICLARGGGTPTGPMNPNWTDIPSYGGIHQRLARYRGKASARKCSDCGTQATHWSYDNSGPFGWTDPECGPYSADMWRYRPRCVRCHSAFDRGVTLLSGVRP